MAMVLQRLRYVAVIALLVAGLENQVDVSKFRPMTRAST